MQVVHYSKNANINGLKAVVILTKVVSISNEGKVWHQIFYMIILGTLQNQFVFYNTIKIKYTTLLFIYYYLFFLKIKLNKSKDIYNVKIFK